VALDDIEITVGPPSSYWDREPAPTTPRRYAVEKDAERALVKLLDPYFTLYDQVRLTETGYAPQYIDYVAVFKDADAQSTLKLIGIEVKSGFDDVKSACAVIKQAMRYKKARISDPRLTRFLNDLLPYVAIWPEFNWCIGTEWCADRPNAKVVEAAYVARCQGEARALYLLAQHWNIGHIAFRPWWSRNQSAWRPGIVLMNGQQQVWTSRYIDQITDGFRGGASLASDPKRGRRFLG
jgi:hypothetical protein